MDRTWESIRDEVFELDTASQAMLVDEIVEHLASSAPKASWVAEAKRRLAAYRSGELTTIDPAEIFAKTKRMIEEARGARA